MPRLLAIEWDQQSVRLVLADSDRRQNLRVIAFSNTAVASGEEPVARRIGTAVRDAVRVAGAEKARCLIGVPHGQIDLAHVQVPRSTDDELPGLVLNLAQRELATATDGAAVDFVAYQSDENMRPVCVTVLPEEELLQIRAVCEHAGIQPARIVPRAFGLKAFCAETEPTVVVSCTKSNADIVLLNQRQPLVARSLRFPTQSTPHQIGRYLTNELRRTLLSHPLEEQIPETIGNVRILSDGALAEAMRGPLAEEFETQPVISNPFSHLKTSLPAPPGTEYSSLLGMLLMESSDERPDVDFLNPKQTRQPASKTRPIVAATLCLAAVVLAGVWFTQSQLADIDAENDRLTVELTELKDLVKKTASKRQLAKAVSAWEASRINWPDELRDITIRMPPRSDMTIRNLSVSAGRNGTSLMSFRGVANSPDAVAIMESRLRDKHHNPRTPGLREQRAGDKTVWTFQTSMSLTSRSAREYASHLPVGAAGSPGDQSPLDQSPNDQSQSPSKKSEAAE